MKSRSAIKTDLFADEHHRKTIDTSGDPLAEIESYIDFSALAAEFDRTVPRPLSLQGCQPPYPSETMVRIVVLKRQHNLSDEQMEYLLLDHMSYKRFFGLANATHIPDRTTVWTFENRIGEADAKALFYGVSAQLPNESFIASDGQIIARLLPAPASTAAAMRRRSSGRARYRPAGSPRIDGKRTLAQLDQRTRRNPLRLQVFGGRRQKVQNHAPDRNEQGQNSRLSEF